MCPISTDLTLAQRRHAPNPLVRRVERETPRTTSTSVFLGHVVPVRPATGVAVGENK